MSNKKQTAVDWLAEQMLWNEFHCPYLDQAKEMEKQQIIKAVDSNFSYDDNGYPTLGEQYYKETYETSN